MSKGKAHCPYIGKGPTALSRVSKFQQLSTAGASAQDAPSKELNMTENNCQRYTRTQQLSQPIHLLPRG